MTIVIAAGFASIAPLTVTVAVGMCVLAFRQGLLTTKPEPRRCPTCGQRLRGWACWSCTNSHRT